MVTARKRSSNSAVFAQAPLVPIICFTTPLVHRPVSCVVQRLAHAVLHMARLALVGEVEVSSVAGKAQPR